MKVLGICRTRLQPCNFVAVWFIKR